MVRRRIFVKNDFRWIHEEPLAIGSGRCILPIMQLKPITEPLLRWYRLNARELPWRKNISPYRTWVSEIMLQQTRVDTVIPYYERFLSELPTLEALASVPEERLLKLWEGLGYYSRARNLQKAARAVVEKHGGVFPAEYPDILALPGIGEYTAGAIASIAFGKPVPAVDGNVLRVICRLTGSRRDLADPKTKAEIRGALQDIYPAEHCGDFTQSLMELGATVCLPNGAPRCGGCPLAEFCTARKDGTTGEIPVKAPKKGRKIELKTVLLLFCGDQVAVRRRAGQGLLAGLWEFPMLDGHPGRAEILEYLRQSGIAVNELSESVTAKHIFSHLEWHMNGWRAECASTDGPAELIWTTRQRLKQEITLPTAFKAFSKQT
jgi:A/G-specific adenine glycosylase